MSVPIHVFRQNNFTLLVQKFVKITTIMFGKDVSKNVSIFTFLCT